MMKDKNKTKQQLIAELEVLQRRVVELKKPEDERKRVEEKLRQVAEEWRSTFDSISDLVSIQDSDSRLVRVNKAYADAVKMKPEEIIGKHCYQVVHGREKPVLNCPHKQVLKTKKPCMLECVEPGVGVFEMSASPIFDGKGEAIGSVHIAKDITERKRMEEELKGYQCRLEELVEKRTNELAKANELLQQEISERKQAEEALKTSHRFLKIANRHTEMNPLLKEFVAEVQNLTDCAAVGLRVLDEEGNIPYQAYEGFSQKFYESESPLSIKSDQCMCINVIKGTTDPKLPFYTASGSFYMNGTTRFLATVSEQEKGQTRNVCNQFRYESVALIPIRLEEHILGLIHVADPSESMVPLEMVETLEMVAMQLGAAFLRVKAEEALKESEKRYRTLFNSGNDIVFVHYPTPENKPGKLIEVNDIACQILGYTREELLKLTPSDLVAFEKVKFSPDAVMKKLSKEKRILVESILVSKDGREIPVEVSPHLFDFYGRPIILTIIRDITERKRKEEELEQYRHHLEEMVQKRTGQLTKANKQLKQEINERKQAEETLRESEDRYHVLFNSGNDAVFAHHPTPDNQPGVFIEVNDVACQMLGYTREELLELSPLDLVAFEKVKLSPDAAMKKLSKEKRILTESVFVTKDGREIPVEVSPHLFDFHGRPTILTVVHDITRRKRVEAELQKNEQRIRELATAYVRAQEEERQWIALEVHDRILQTLTAIFHQLQVLKSATQATPETQDVAVHAFTLIKEVIRETRNVMKDLYPQALAKFGLVPLINEELHRFQEETGVRVRLLTSCPVRAPKDVETTFYRVFHEAILNVKKHATNAKSVTVSLTCKEEISELQVEDDGDGFDAVATMQGKVPGGLESMRRRTEIVGGTFEVKSISGKGTTVTVHIPLLLKTEGNYANNSRAGNTTRKPIL